MIKSKARMTKLGEKKKKKKKHAERLDRSKAPCFGPNSQVVKAKEMFLEETKSASLLVSCLVAELTPSEDAGKVVEMTNKGLSWELS